MRVDLQNRRIHRLVFNNLLISTVLLLLAEPSNKYLVLDSCIKILSLLNVSFGIIKFNH